MISFKEFSCPSYKGKVLFQCENAGAQNYLPLGEPVIAVLNILVSRANMKSVNDNLRVSSCFHKTRIGIGQDHEINCQWQMFRKLCC